MTLLAGAFNISGALPRSDELLAAMSRALSRTPSDRLEIVRDARALLAKVDIGAFQARGHHVEDGTATFITGDPICGDSVHRTRTTDTAVLHRALRAREYDRLKDARGVYSVAHYNASEGRMVFATDKLGVRPIYWWTDGDTVVFSSTQRLLEACTLLAKQIDVRGLAERIGIGYSLGDHTPYSTISLLRAGELVELTSAGIKRVEYWRWQDIAPSAESAATARRTVYDAFREGVRLRLAHDRAVTAFLSGGLDSRCVVAALRSENVGVHTFNFSPAGSEDREFGAALARIAGTTHEEHEVDPPIDPQWSAMIAKARHRSSAAIKTDVNRPHMVWSGDGGSVGLGHVYMRPAIVERCLTGDVEGAAAAYIEAERAVLPERLLRPSMVSQMAAAPKAGVVDELSRLATNELLQTFYLFLMQNDQRRHLVRHFEDIDQHRVELLLPFFDMEFLALVASIPIEERLYHKFYVTWLDEFPDYVRTTYWQAYPGHVACPVPNTKVLGYQWDPSVMAAKRAQLRRTTLRSAVTTLFAPRFASALMKRHVLALATIAHASGLRNYDYIVRAARMIQEHWSACQASIEH